MAHVTPLLFPTYLSLIEGAVGSAMFQHSYALVDGVEKDILEDGDLSCAFFVSSILTITRLSKEIHATVSGTIRDIESFGWVNIDAPRVGAVLVWEPKEQARGPHEHIGFCVSDTEAISNNWETQVPARHHITYGTNSDGSPVRNLTAIYWHPLLGA
jgi:hypothetical protein